MKIFFTIVGLFALSNAFAETQKLTEYEVFKLNYSNQFEPSGLTLKNGELFTVCDDLNGIYKLSLNDDQTASVILESKLPVEKLSALNLDQEGITSVDGEFFVVSEAHHKLVKVSGDQLKWVPEQGSVYKNAFEQGLFQVYNAGVEAVTYLGDRTFLLAVEREPRGLIEVTFNEDFSAIVKQTNQVSIASEHQLIGSGAADLTGLFTHNGVTYALFRNAYVVHELIKNEFGQYVEGKSWSFEHIARHPDYVYADMTFGQAEGLAVDDDYFYIVFDNNNIPNAKNPNDKRPILIRAERK